MPDKIKPTSEVTPNAVKPTEIKPTTGKEETIQVEQEMFHTLIIEDVKYKTLLTKKYASRKKYEPSDPKKIRAFIPGTIKKIYTKKGKRLKEGDKILDLEAMKMVNTIFAPFNCQILEVHIKEGMQVPKNSLLISLK